MTTLTTIPDGDNSLRAMFYLPERGRPHPKGNYYSEVDLVDIQRVINLVSSMIHAGADIEEILQRIHSPKGTYR